MGTIAVEKGVLKLVHPGRRVEVYKEPITAAEVLRRYPRHCITRPDIFEFPWIVVKPEAVLTPGRVFFIVPKRTIYPLLKAREHCDDQPSSSSKQRTCHKDHGQQQLVSKETSAQKTYAGMTPKHQEHRKRLKNQFMNLSSCANATVSPTDQEPDRGHQTDLQVGFWTDLFDKRQSKIYSKIETRYAKENDYSINGMTANAPRKVDGDLKFAKSKQVTMLKSCLRKPDSARKLLHFKVAFALSDKDEERQSKVTDQQMVSRLCLN